MARVMSHLEGSVTGIASVLCLALCLSVWLAGFVAAAETQAGGYTGNLNTDLVPTPTLGIEKPMPRASEAERKLLPIPPLPEDQVFYGTLAIWSSKGLRLAYVRPKSGAPYI